MSKYLSYEHAINYTVMILCAVMTLYVLTYPLQDPDTFWHLAYGRAMVEQGAFINHEIFSYTSQGVPLASHSQLAQVLLYLIWSAGGVTGLLAFKLSIGLATFAIIVVTARFFSVNKLFAPFLAMIVITAGMGRFVERPELFSILFQALIICCLFGYSRGFFTHRALWVLPPVLVVWDYLHGAIFGLVILLVFVAVETLKSVVLAKIDRVKSGWGGCVIEPKRLKELWLWTGITLFSMALHPNGLLVYRRFFRVTSNTQEYSVFAEWSPTLSSGLQFFWYWFCLAALLVLVLLTLRRIDLTALAIVLPFLYLSLKFNRATLAFCLAAVPLAAHCMALVYENLPRSSWKRWAAGLAGGVLLLAPPIYKEVYAPNAQKFGVGLNENAYPVGSTRFVRDLGLKGNMFNTDHSGGYLAFFAAPEQKIFHYNQPGEFTALSEYIHKPETRSRWNISYAIVRELMEYKMFEPEGFVPVYREPSGMVLLKPGGENDVLIKKYRIRYFDPTLSTEKLETLSKSPLAGRRLLEEMSIYLTYRADARIAWLLGKLLNTKNPETKMGFLERRPLLENALRQNRDSVALLLSLGNLDYRMQNLDKAAILFDEVLTLDGKNLSALLSRGYIHYDRKEYLDALELFRVAIDAAPKEPDAYYALGLAAYRYGDSALANNSFKTFVQLAPTSPYVGKAKGFLEKLR
ncbi:tetratricopeptide repeat protein [Deltaproteobacteria bacterium IMCC39524]|nr:tetratricopeptide repeat protein [Deltaproteobacteria bacterium IMCC39524]